MVPIDLHVHSDFSCCPVTMQEATWEAKLAGIRTIGFADHYDKILDNSTFEKYYQGLTEISKIQYLNVKKGIEFESKDFEKLLVDLNKVNQRLDYVLYHNLENSDYLHVAAEFQKKLNLQLMVAHPNVGLWDIDNDKIISIIKENNLIIEVNKTHLSLLKGKELEKEKNFFKKVLAEKSILLTFGSDYHEYSSFQTKNVLYNKIWDKIEKERVYLYNSILEKTNDELPQINRWISSINIKDIFQKPIFQNKSLKINPIVLNKLKLLNKTDAPEEIITFISEQNNTGLNMFYFSLIQKFSGTEQEKTELFQKLHASFAGSKLKDIRRYFYKTIFEVSKKGTESKETGKILLQQEIMSEKSQVLIKNLNKYISELNVK